MKTIPVKILNPFDDTSVEFCAPPIKLPSKPLKLERILISVEWSPWNTSMCMIRGGMSFHHKAYVIMLESQFTSDLSDLTAVVLTGLTRSRENKLNSGDEEDEQHDSTDDCQHP